MDHDEDLADLMATSGARLLRLAYQLCHDRSGAQDLVQEAMMSVMTSWRRRMPDVSHREAYLRRSVVNEYLRKKRLRSSTEVVTSEVPDPPSAAFDAEVTERDRIWRALATLPSRQRTVLVLRFYEDLSDAAIAELIGARPATVRSLAARGIATLRQGQLAEVGP